MPKYLTMMPVWASAKYELNTDEPVSDPEKLKELMLEKGTPTGDTCWSCSKHIEVEPTNADYEQWEKYFEPDCIWEDDGER